MRRIFFTLMLAAALVGGAAGIAFASIPAPDGTIDGCYKTSAPGQGALAVIDSAATCPSGTTALNWNQTGPQGPAGPAGPQGPSGPRATSSVVTRDIHYSPSGASFADTQAVDCTGGLLAINGGVLQTTADAAWTAAAPTADSAFPGSAVAQEGAEVPNLGTSSHVTDPVNPSLPRPVSSGASWKVKYAGDFPYTSTGSIVTYGVTVTLYAICE